MSQTRVDTQAAPMKPQVFWLWLGLALAVLGGLRLLALNWTPVGLHVDEAQYWLWSRQLDWGYFSKPPGIAALIAASTALLGDGSNGVRALSMLCWLACSALLVSLGTRMHSQRAGLWAGVLFSATPAANLLGLVATTDSLLMLGWIGVMVCAWRLCPPGAPSRQAWGGWLALGLVWGMTLASKYTAAALAPSLLWVVWQASRVAEPGARKPLWTGVLLALAVAAACLLPNVMWNAGQGWPTLQHTLDITVRAGQLGADDGRAHAFLRVLHFVGGVWVVSGPGLWVVAVLAALAWRRAAPPRPTLSVHTHQALHWAAWFVWPLTLIGLAQALSGGVQINWTAPVLAGLCLMAGIWMAERPASQARTRWVLFGVLASLLLSLWVAASQDLRWPASTPAGSRALDFWHKTRHWAPALAPILPRLAREPMPVWTQERDVLVQTAYAGRSQPPELRSWSADGRIHHHFDQFYPAMPGPAAVWWLGRQPPPPALADQWAQATWVQTSGHGPLRLELWRLDRPLRSMK